MFRMLPFLAIMMASCVSTTQHTVRDADIPQERTASIPDNIPPGGTTAQQPTPMSGLARTEDGAYVLTPGFYEAEFKTYCLQPGTPDPSPRDAYIQAPLGGYRKDIIHDVLLNSRAKPGIDQKHVQLLLWSVVSGSDFNKLPREVQDDAMQLLTRKQVFELKGGVAGLVRTVSSHLPAGSGSGGSAIKRLFEAGASSYEAYERMAVLREPAVATSADYDSNQWHKQVGDYYLRHIPVSYKKVRIQVYVPQGAADSTGKSNGEYLLFNPTGMQAIPANSNAQRLGVGGAVIDVVRVIVRTTKTSPPKRLPAPEKPKKGSPKA